MAEKSRLGKVIGLFKYVKAYNLYMVLSVIIGLIFKILPMLTTFLLSYMVGLLVNGQSANELMTYFYVLIILVILQGMFSYADTWVSHDIAYRILAKLRIQLYHKVEEISPAYLHGNRSGRIVSILLEDVEILEWFYAHTMGIAIITLLITIIALSFLWLLYPLIAVSVMFWIVIAGSVPFIFKKKSDKHGHEVRSKLAELSAELVDGVNGIKDIVSLNWQSKFKQKIGAANRVYDIKRLIDGRRKSSESMLIGLVVSLAMFTTTAISAYLVSEDLLSPVWFPVVVSLSGAIFIPILEFLGISTKFGLIFAAAGRVFDILESEPAVKDEGDKELKKVKEYTIEFKDVSFSYPKSDKKAIDQVSFTINPGEVVALAGASGAGKSTISSLLQRFWDYDSGDILINGQTVKDIKLNALRNNLAVVLQDVYLFNTSIYENLQMSREDADQVEIMEACKNAIAHEFIVELENGYDTVVGERGTSLSGGQRQRIAIARAFIKNTPMLIFDEASSSLDSDNESKLNDVLSRFGKKKSIMMIAHRKSTLESADKVVFLDRGKVIDIGTFKELENRCRLFRETVGIS